MQSVEAMEAVASGSRRVQPRQHLRRVIVLEATWNIPAAFCQGPPVMHACQTGKAGAGKAARAALNLLLLM
jgi:hypothetical protein